MKPWIAFGLQLAVATAAIAWASADAHLDWPVGLLGAGLGVSHYATFSLGRAARRTEADPYWPCGCPRDWPPHEHPRSEEEAQ